MHSAAPVLKTGPSKYAGDILPSTAILGGSIPPESYKQNTKCTTKSNTTLINKWSAN